jgi:hypothetical protein
MRGLQLAPLLVALLLPSAPVAGCDPPQGGDTDPRQGRDAPHRAAAKQPPVQHVGSTVIHVRLAPAPHVGLISAQEVALTAAARRFAVSLTAWLYGHRRSRDVEPGAPVVRRELAHTPPYIPRDQRATNDGRAVRVEVALQTSGVLTVAVTDSRTSYRIPASFVRRNARWRIVHLHTH